VDQALTLCNLASCYSLTGKHAQSAEATRAAVRLARAPQDFPRVQDLQRMLRRNGGATAAALIGAGQADEGFRLYHDLREHFRGLSAAHPKEPHLAVHLAEVAIDLGKRFAKAGRGPEAAQAFEEAAATLKKVAADDKGASAVRAALCQAYFDLGSGLGQR